MGWSAGDIEVEIDDYGTSDPVLTATVTTPAGVLSVMAEPKSERRKLLLDGLHVQSDLGANQFGWLRIRWLVQAIMEKLDVDEIIVQGAIRTTGSNRGRRPRPYRFTRTR